MSWSSRRVSTRRYFSGRRCATCQTWRRVSFDSWTSTGSKEWAVDGRLVMSSASSSSVDPQVALPPAQLVVAEVPGHGMDPAAEVERLVDPLHHPEGLHEGLLGDVLSQQRVAQLAADEPEDRCDIPPVELFERVGIPLPVGPDELDVRRLAPFLASRLCL